MLQEKQNTEYSDDNTEVEEQVQIAMPALTEDDIEAMYDREQLRETLGYIKDASFSMDCADYDMAINSFMSIIAVQIDMDKATKEQLDLIVEARIKDIPELMETYEVLSVGREFFSLHSRNSFLTNIAIENLKRDVVDLYDRNIINNEQLAQGYHNVALLFEVYEGTKNYYVRGDNPQIADYMAKALSLTSNIELINTCINYLQEKSGKKNALIREACERALKSDRNQDDEARFSIYSIYAKSYISQNASEILNGKKTEGEKTALIYYLEALKYAKSEKDKIKTLHSIAKLQVKRDKKAYLATQLELASYLTGREKILELMTLAKGCEGKDKIMLLEGAVSELIDTHTIPEKERQIMWKNISSDLRTSYGNNKDKVDYLDGLEQKYFNFEKEIITKPKRMASSKGNDYFVQKKSR
ncbi:MAG: hypothetical protein E7019_06140 [Alphaproteobacteria bacterium]|nr:hypothetical protein [Alphaproteobacteria bacterium]